MARHKLSSTVLATCEVVVSALQAVFKLGTIATQLSGNTFLHQVKDFRFLSVLAKNGSVEVAVFFKRNAATECCQTYDSSIIGLVGVSPA